MFNESGKPERASNPCSDVMCQWVDYRLTSFAADFKNGPLLQNVVQSFGPTKSCGESV